MILLYILFCGLFYLGASLDELPKGSFKRWLFYLSCFIEGAIDAHGDWRGSLVYIKNNEKTHDTRHRTLQQ